VLHQESVREVVALVDGDDATRYVHAGEEIHRQPSLTWPLAPPIVQTTVYAYPDTAAIDAVHDGTRPGYIYSRYGLPNSAELEAAMCELEGGAAAVAMGSATGVITCLFVALTGTGQRVVVGHNTYGGTRAVLDYDLKRFGLTTTYVDLTDEDAVQAALTPAPTPALLYADTLSNPTLITNDIPRLGELAARAGVPLVVDNTFATPYHFQPLAHGATLVVHSATKFIGGHNDVTGGIAIGPADLIARLRAVGIRTGATGGPFESWLALRGLRTMEVRLQRSSANALALAEALVQHPLARRVHYPGLAGDPRNGVARRMLRNGFGSVLAVDFGTERVARQVVDRLQLIQIAETLGGLMTTVVLPKLNYYRSLDNEVLLQLGISPGLVRVSVGIEHAADLIADMFQSMQPVDG
jgi:cystathionine beta-lyase/cystathionine gamma-synthase